MFFVYIFRGRTIYVFTVKRGSVYPFPFPLPMTRSLCFDLYVHLYILFIRPVVYLNFLFFLYSIILIESRVCLCPSIILKTTLLTMPQVDNCNVTTKSYEREWMKREQINKHKQITDPYIYIYVKWEKIKRFVDWRVCVCVSYHLLASLTCSFTVSPFTENV